jgi:IclR family KDG regulon transcriptional repressor
MRGKDKDIVSSLQKAIKIINTYSEDDMLQSIEQLSKRTGYPKTTVHRIVQTLVLEGWMIQDSYSKRYGLGYGLLGLEKLVLLHENLIKICDPYMKKLKDTLNETVTLSVLEKDHSLCIHKIETEHHVKLTSKVGSTMPLYAGSTAKCLLAFQDDSFIREYLYNTELIQFTNKTVTDPEQIIKDLLEIRKQGYSKSESEVDVDTFTVSVPIINKKSNVFCCISISCPTYRYSKKLEEDMIRLALKTKNDINGKI